MRVTIFNHKVRNIQLRWARTKPQRYLKFLRKIGVKIGENITFHGKLSTISIDITRPSLVTIGSNVSFNGYFNLITHDWGTFVIRNYFHDFVPSSGRVTIGNNVVFGRNVTVLKGVTIGDNCIIGTGAVVTKDVPRNSVALGVPARVTSTLEDYYNKRKQKCIEEAFEYARSIKERFGRQPVLEDFWEEFPLFLNGEDLNAELPIRRQLGHVYDYYNKNHKALFNGLEDFILKAGL